MLNYINLKYKPKKEDLIVEYCLEPDKVSFQQAAENIAGESSIGTWTDVGTLNKTIVKNLKPSVFYLDEKEHIVKIAYPPDLFEKGNMPQIFSSIAGNIFGMSTVKNLRLEDISFPKSLVNSFKGPMHGIQGIRKLMKVEKRPLVGTIIKPKVGLNEKQHAKVAYDSWIGGLDIVKDDENLSNMKFNKFEKRIIETIKLRNKAEKETGEKKIYMPNVTAETNEMLKRAKFVKKQGCEYAMVDILSAGWASVQSLRNAELGLVIHAHRAGHAALTRNPEHGISMLVIAKAARLIGVDQIHVGAIVGKMQGSKEEVLAIGEEIEKKILHSNRAQHVLEQNWYKIKPIMAVCSGGLHPGKIAPLIEAMGNNIVMQFGGGCHGHPDGTMAGATAIRQAVEATIRKISLEEYSETHTALRRALEKWG